MDYVGFWARVGASLLDTVILLIITTPPLLWIYGWEHFLDPGKPLIAGPAEFLISWVFPAAMVLWFWLRKEATPGKMVIGAHVVDATTGGPMSLSQAAVRYLGYFVATLPLLLGFFWVAFDARKQGWHDKMANTVVVRARKRGPHKVEFTR
ncbi:MAG: RDD family protein [Steroidobacteraceae bacterium]